MFEGKICPVCGGTGMIFVGGFSPCWTCNATGYVPEDKEEEKDGD